MARDHYVPQVHLKNFNNPDGGLHAMLKRDLKTFTNDAKAFCRLEENSTNKYLAEECAIEDFLKLIEPNYNKAIEKIRSGYIDPEAVFVVSGFIAYVMWFSPAGNQSADSTTSAGISAAGQPRVPADAPAYFEAAVAGVRRT